ncbi:hypothetical protein DFJ73DRAFT_959005 [Zopfochytrium polystomum]|nr:hypothetical protein DFJ73DRAFT_959005 [Zopfochytrium polystomum]
MAAKTFSFDSFLKKFRATLGTCTIVVAGESGMGKSTLVNNVVGIDIAKAAAGQPVTTKVTLYKDDYVGIVDTVGFIRGKDPRAQHFDGDLLLKLVDPRQRALQEIYDKNGKLVKGGVEVDCVWYFIERLQPEDERVLKELASMKVPFLVIIAKCDNKTLQEISDIRGAVDNRMAAYGVESSIYGIVEMRRNKPGPEKCGECGFVTELRQLHPSRKRKGWFCSNLDCFMHSSCAMVEDTDSLQQALKSLNESVERLLSQNEETLKRYKKAQLISLESKLALASATVAVATIAAMAIGLSPIPIGDMVLLLTDQCLMVGTIMTIFGIAWTDGDTTQLMLMFVAIYGLPVAGLAGASLLKIVPVFGWFAASAIDGVVAGSMTLVMGIVVTLLCWSTLKSRMEAIGRGENPERPRLEVTKAQVQGAVGRVNDLVKSTVLALVMYGSKDSWKDEVEQFVRDTVNNNVAST